MRRDEQSTQKRGIVLGIEYRELGPADAPLLLAAPPELFDNPIDPEQCDAFLADGRHHIIVALDVGVPVGFATANGYLHPDKPPQAWINELSTLEAHRNRGIGAELVRRMLALLRDRGYAEAWLATEHDNAPARAVYKRVLAERAAHAGATEDEAVVVYVFPLG
ncbi:MAG: GNAT family N-acetyltransferase [Planctomycetota bacterium]